MAKGARNIGNVYVTVVPTMRGSAKSINDQLSGVSTKRAGDAIGKKLGGSIGDGLDLSAVAKKLDSAVKSLQGFGRSISDIGGKLTSGITMPIAAATAGIGAFALSTASAAETTEISFTTMLGSAEAARDMMETLADFAAHTPFELSGLQESTRQLLAYGFAAEDIVPMLTKVGDAVAALGTGQAGIESVTRALGQMQTRGKVSAEEMLQLTEAGIPAWRYLAEAIGTDTAGAMQKVTDGAVSAADGIKAITDGMERDFGGMMEAQSKTVEGLMSNLSDAIEQPLMKLRDSEAYERFADSLSDVVESAGPFVESLLPHMERGLGLVADVLDGAADAMDSFSSMSEHAQGELIGLVAQAALAGPALTVAGKGVQAVGSAMRGVSTVIKTGSKVFDALTGAAKKLDGSLGDLGGGLTGLLGGLSAIPTPAKLLAGVVGGVAVTAIGALASEAAAAAEEEQMMAEVTMSAAEIMGKASSAADGMGDAIGGLKPDVDGVLDSMRELNQSVTDTFSDLYVDRSKLDQYVSVIDELANKSDLSATQQYRLTEAVEGYNEVVGTQYSVVDAANGKIADENGTLQENTDQLHENADAWERRARAEAYQNVATQYMEAEAEAAYNLQVAQNELADAYERRDRAADIINGRIEASAEEIEKARGEWDKLNREIPGMEDNVSNLSDALDTASESARQLTDWGAISIEDLSDEVRASAESISVSLNGMGDDFEAALEGVGVDLTDLSVALAQAGVSTEQLNAVGSDNLSRLAESCQGNIGLMVWAIQNYNDVPVKDKDGNVVIDDAQLVDAQGNIYTWNGSSLVDQNGVAAVNDLQLIDAQGRIYRWNESSLKLQPGSFSINSSPIERALGFISTWNSSGLKLMSGYFDIVTNRRASGNAAGGIRPHAEGGYVPRLHADGAIATKAVPLDIVGEAGAEAIVPLTNRRYSQPFVDLIADGVASKSQTSDVVRAIDALRREIMGMGVYLDSGRLVGGISRDVNRSLGRIQKRGSLA